MITKNQKKAIVSLINVLSVNYTGWGPKDAEQYELYIQMLADLDVKLLADAVINHIKNSKYGPTIAELREMVLKSKAEIQYGLFPSESEAWLEVQKSLSFHGRYDVEKGIESLSDNVRAVVKTIGYIRLCNMAPERAESQFKQYYKSYLYKLIHGGEATLQLETSEGDVNGRIKLDE